MKFGIAGWIAVGVLGTLCAALFIENWGEPRALAAPLVPRPERFKAADGSFALTSQTPLVAVGESESAVDYLDGILRSSTAITLIIQTSNVTAEQQSITFEEKPFERMPESAASREEAYELDVTGSGVRVRSRTAAGFLRAAQTLLQLMPPWVYSRTNTGSNSVPIKCARISDAPRFQWRGFMLDVARHFFNPAEVKRVIDGMAMHKLNKLHMHLTDDQGWRLEIKEYPKLVEIGAWRSGIGFRLDPGSSAAYVARGRYGGYFSEQEAHEIVAYAEARGIEVVPEIDMPGHMSAALSVLPGLSCFGGPYTTDVDAGIYEGILCAGNEETFKFLETVLSRVIQIFPSRYIHIGGDEVPHTNWKKCSKCQARMRAEGLKDEWELQGYFIKRISGFLRAHDRVPVGWSEIIEGGLPEGAVLMDWIGGAREAASSGHGVVTASMKYLYLSMYQSTNRAAEPRALGGFIPLEAVYEFEPVPPGLAREYQKNILGPEAALWTEYIPNLGMAEYMMYPRLCALSEVAWSGPKHRSFSEFQRRLNPHLERLKAAGINFRR